MMHQPVDYKDARFYVAEIPFLPNGEGMCAGLSAPRAVRTGAGVPLVRGDYLGNADARHGELAPLRRRARRTPRTGAR